MLNTLINIHYIYLDKLFNYILCLCINVKLRHNMNPREKNPRIVQSDNH